MFPDQVAAPSQCCQPQQQSQTSVEPPSAASEGLSLCAENRTLSSLPASVLLCVQETSRTCKCIDSISESMTARNAGPAQHACQGVYR